MEIDHSFTIRDLSSKYRIKTKLYNMLVREGQISSLEARGYTKILKRCYDGEKELY